MTAVDNISLIISELQGRVTELESLITDIKTLTESPYSSEKVKVRRVQAVIRDYGY